MLKRTLPLLAVLLTAMSLAACGSSSPTAKHSSTGSTALDAGHPTSAAMSAAGYSSLQALAALNGNFTAAAKAGQLTSALTSASAHCQTIGKASVDAQVRLVRQSCTLSVDEARVYAQGASCNTLKAAAQTKCAMTFAVNLSSTMSGISSNAHKLAASLLSGSCSDYWTIESQESSKYAAAYQVVTAALHSGARNVQQSAKQALQAASLFAAQIRSTAATDVHSCKP